MRLPERHEQHANGSKKSQRDLVNESSGAALEHSRRLGTQRASGALTGVCRAEDAGEVSATLSSLGREGRVARV